VKARKGALDLEGESPAPEQVERTHEASLIHGILVVARAQARADIEAASERSKVVKAGRGLGVLTEQALVASFLVFDTVGTPNEPISERAMARAIADAAAAAGITSADNPLDPESSSVKRVARAAFKAAALVKERDAKRLEVRWSPTVGQFDGLVKLGPGCCQAANLIMLPTP
jgi:hypothetical protein